MVKKSFLAIFIFIFLFLVLSHSSVILAQGTCSASPTESRCQLERPHRCDAGYSPDTGDHPSCVCRCRSTSGISNPLITGELAKLSGTEFLNKFIGFALSFGFIIAAIVFFFIFISGGIRWITSGGDKDRVGQARGQITNAIIGLLLTFALYVILGIIEDFFGISLRQLKLPVLGD